MISFLVSASFGSKINGLAILSKFNLTNAVSLATFTLSSADAVSCLVFCPNATKPAPVTKEIGLMCTEYNESLSPSATAVVSNSPSVLI